MITNMMALVAGQVHEEDDQHHGQSQACGSHILGSRRKGNTKGRMLICPNSVQGDGVRHSKEDWLPYEALLWRLHAQPARHDRRLRSSGTG